MHAIFAPYSVEVGAITLSSLNALSWPNWLTKFAQRYRKAQPYGKNSGFNAFLWQNWPAEFISRMYTGVAQSATSQLQQLPA